MCIFAVSVQIPSVCDISSSELTSSPDTTLTSGLLSSFMARNGGQKAAGTRACPWSLRAAEYQRITLSIIEFRDPTVSSAATAGGDDDLAFPSCVVVVERSATGNRSSVSMFCGGGRRRENLVYTSTSNVIDVYVANMTSSREFLIKYEGNDDKLTDSLNCSVFLFSFLFFSLSFSFFTICKFQLPTIKYEFNKRNFIVRSLFNYSSLCNYIIGQCCYFVNSFVTCDFSL